MAGIKDLSNIWKNIKEIDLKPIRDAATHPVRINLVGEPASGRHTLADQMRSDPARPEVHTQSSLAILPVDTVAEVPVAHLIIVIADASRGEFSAEQALVKKWCDAGKNVLVFINKIDFDERNISNAPLAGWQTTRVLFGSVNDIAYLQREFVPAVLDLLPQQHLALGRQFPLFRIPIARQLINDTCFSNAAYSLSTGLAEIVPILDLPLNVTDMIVLTKSQAFLAYKLGLLVGFSTRWQDYVSEFGSVIGGGFLWRQIARGLVGLIPAWGIVPKVAVAYSGTYVVGNAILGWYLTGKNLSPKQLRALSIESFARGKEFARKLLNKLPQPRLGRKQAKLTGGRITTQLSPGETVITTADRQNREDITAESDTESTNTEREQSTSIHIAMDEPIVTNEKQPGKRKRRFIWQRKGESSKIDKPRICEKCGKSSSADAVFCQYCGNQFNA